MFSQNHVRLIKRLLFLLFPYFLLRVGFYFYHFDTYKLFPYDVILKSFILGIRFDIAAIILVNIPIIVISFLPIKNKQFLFLERVAFIFLNTLAFLVSLDDYELFSFMGKRLSYDLFYITDDIFQQLPQIILNYWFIPLFTFILSVVYYFFDKKYFSLKAVRFSWRSLPLGVLLLGCFFVGIRGGFQHKSINVQSAFIQGRNELGHLVLNSPYHFIRTLKNSRLNKLKYFSSNDEIKEIILGKRSFSEGIKGRTRANVILIILESFSSEYLENGYTPFLSELKSKGLYFPNHLANGRRSIEALPSLLCGLPSLLNEPISKSIYSGNNFKCFPEFLKESGYTNYFFHGGARGTMGFDSYVLANGFHKYFSREDYGAHDFDGTWGVFDLPYFNYVADEISKIKNPFLVGIFSLSSHQPYSIPGEFKNKFPKGTLEIHESIGYTDFALRKFFEKAQNTSWFKNTLFIITADHTQKLETSKFSNLVGRYRVPLLIYGPEVPHGEIHKITQHSDIPKTVLDYVEVEGGLPATSESVFTESEGVAMNFADGTTFFIAQKDRIKTLDIVYSYDWKTGNMKRIDSSDKEDTQLAKAYLQYFVNGLINNDLSL